MENRKYLILLALVAGFFVIQAVPAYGYGTDTHQFLTDTSIHLYNDTYTNDSIDQKLIPFLLDGARREDDAPRWMNHFYDPINEKGLYYNAAIDPWINLGNWQSAKLWAQDSAHQTRLMYTPAIASILSFLDTGTIQKFLPTSDFTWNTALAYWKQGDREMALFTLGHIVHLLQDMSVPDHTRNDPHPSDSPYENYTAQFTPSHPDTNVHTQAKNKGIINLSHISDYFTQSAKYSNNNFYSKDTVGIQSGYSLPQPDNSEIIGHFNYQTREIPESGTYILAVHKSAGLSLLESTVDATTIDNNTVQSDYWRLLSTKAVQYSAGLIHLFIQEAYAKEKDPSFTARPESSFLGQILTGAQTIFNQAKDFVQTTVFGKQNFTTTQEIPLQQSGVISLNNNETPTPTPYTQSLTINNTHTPTPSIQGTSSPSPQQSPYVLPTIKPTPTIKPVATATPRPTITPTPSPRTSTPTPTPQPTTNVTASLCGLSYTSSPWGPLIINEVAWMGTTASTADEWIELKNIGSTSISLLGWTLRNANGSIAIALGSGTTKTLSPGEHFLLERTDDTSVPAIQADLIYTGALANNDERLQLFNSLCVLQDAISATPQWPAGNATEKRTMERNESTHGWYSASSIGGTPHAKNSALPTPTPPPSGGGGGSYNPTPTPTPIPTSTPSPTPTPTPTPIPSPTPTPIPEATPVPTGALQITEFMYNTSDADEGREWIEVHNTSIENIPTEIIRISEGGSHHYVHTTSDTDGTLLAETYIVIANNPQKFMGDYPSYTGPLFKSAFSLSNEGEVLQITNQDTVVDEVSYTKDQGANGNGKTLQHIEGVWYEATPSPGQVNSIDDVSQTETTTSSETASQEPQQVHITYTPATVSISATWDYEPHTHDTEITYTIHDLTDPAHDRVLATTTDIAATIPLRTIGTTYRIGVQATQEGKKPSLITPHDISVPSFVKNITFYNATNPTADIFFDHYPFIPNGTQEAMGKRLMVFYYNTNAVPQTIIEGSIFNTDNAWGPEAMHNLTDVAYNFCRSGYGPQHTLIMADDLNTCFGTIAPESIDTKEIRIFPETSAPESGSFLTVAFFTLTQSNIWSGGSETYTLLAVDKTHYPFTATIPKNPPTNPDIISVTTTPIDASGGGQLSLRWKMAIDPDGYNNRIQYSIAYSLTSDNNEPVWENISCTPSGNECENASKRVAVPGAYRILLRAKDEQENYSDSMEAITTVQDNTLVGMNKKYIDICAHHQYI